jgi:signal transduction histidine kinase
VNTLRRHPAFGHAARVAAVTTVLIAVLYVLVGGILDVVAVGRLTHQVDARLANVLRDGVSEPAALGDRVRYTGSGRGQDLDDAPVLLWRVSASGAVRAVSAAAPALPAGAWSAGRTTTATVGASQLRLEARAVPGGGWLVAGQSLAEARHVRAVLLAAEAVVAPVILLAIYLGALTIGIKASAPVERTRRRQLEFTADASHELRTPLSVIEAEVGLALGTPRQAAYYRESLERVGAESRRLRRIVEDLLWLARFDSEPPPPGDEPVDLTPIAMACVERFEPVARARRIILAVDADPVAPALTKAPPEWIDRLLGVLVDNACRYSPSEGRVTVRVEAIGARVQVAVDDDGPGIPEEERSRLFDRFHRASDQPGGAGLGLAIADSVVRSTGGRWRIGSSPSGGARMEVSWHRSGAGPDRRGPVAEERGRKPSADAPPDPPADAQARDADPAGSADQGTVTASVEPRS